MLALIFCLESDPAKVGFKKHNFRIIVQDNCSSHNYERFSDLFNTTYSLRNYRWDICQAKWPTQR